MNNLFTIAVVVITNYLTATILTFGIPESISATHYLWKSKGMKFMFTAVMTLTAFSVLPYWIEHSSSNLQFLPFLSVAGMLFVGGACAFKETLTKSVHYVSAGVWALSALLFFSISKMWTPMIIGLLFSLIMWIVLKFRNTTFWAEIAVVVMMIVGISML